MRWVTFLAVPALVLAGSLAQGSEGVDDVIRLQQAGLSPDVLTAFVENSSVAYDLTADEITRLENAGVPATSIVAMIDHGKELRAKQAPAAPAATAPVTAAPVTGPPVTTPVENTAGSPQAPVITSPPTVTVPPQESMNVSYFYEALAPYGEWFWRPPNGWVWRPQVALTVSDWRPYCHGGHWAWTDYGWYWESGYSWGWAPFHYGRWYGEAGLGWVWAPDTVWGPSWVQWRSSDACYAWAPLSPEVRFDAGIGFMFHGGHVGFDFDFGLGVDAFTCVPCESFLALDLGFCAYPRSRVGNVFNNTTIVKNTYVYNNNSQLVNSGIATRQVAARTGQNIQTMQIADARATPGQPIPGERRSGNSIVAFRPSVANTAPLSPVQVLQRQRQAGTGGTLAGSRALAQPSSSQPASTAESAARNRLGLEKQRLQAQTGATRPEINREVQTEHRSAVESEQAARARVADEKARLGASESAGAVNRERAAEPGMTRSNGSAHGRMSEPPALEERSRPAEESGRTGQERSSKSTRGGGERGRRGE
ncbi:MAG: DUF6600 domain-containing protein [Planctomycetota bacterium]